MSVDVEWQVPNLNFNPMSVLAHIHVAGATLQHTQTRRPPHAFNFLRQVEIIERSGGSGVEQQMEDQSFQLSLHQASWLSC